MGIAFTALYIFAFQTTAMATEKKKRPITPLEIILLAIAIIIVLSIGLQKSGMKVLYQKDETEIIQKPHAPDRRD